MTEQPHYLVVGSGNIARRHLANLKHLFPDSVIGCISTSGKLLNGPEIGADVIYHSLPQAMEKPLKFAIIATAAPFHLEQAAQLLEKNIPVLIEKPLTHNLTSYKKVKPIFYSKQHKVDVAYNLRYMPSALFLKTLLDEKLIGKIHSVLIEVGQFLPDWRPQTDYRQSVSAKKALGGGVLLELSHELDYLTWLLGDFDHVFCLAATSGSLKIDVEDTADAIFTRKDGVVANLHVDFLQRSASRICKLIGEFGTLEWNLLTNRISHFQQTTEVAVLFDDPNYNRNNMYLDELSRFAKVAQGELLPLVNFEQGLRIVHLIEAMKHSSVTKKMIPIGDYRE